MTAEQTRADLREAEGACRAMAALHPASGKWWHALADRLDVLAVIIDQYDEVEIPPFEDDPVAMALGLTPRKPGVKIPGEPDHCDDCAREARRDAVIEAAKKWRDAYLLLYAEDEHRSDEEHAALVVAYTMSNVDLVAAVDALRADRQAGTT